MGRERGERGWRESCFIGVPIRHKAQSSKDDDHGYLGANIRKSAADLPAVHRPARPARVHLHVHGGGRARTCRDMRSARGVLVSS